MKTDIDITKHKRETFQSPYDQYKHYIGLGFEIVEVITPKDVEETGVLYYIKLDNEEYIEAWPEEVFDNTGWNPNNSNLNCST